MRKFVLVAAMLMASASAHAGGYSFNIEGHNIRVNIPRNCSSLSCMSVAAPSITNKFKDEEPVSAKPSKTPAAPAAATTAPAAPAPATAAPAPIVTAAVPPASKVTVMPAPATETYSTSPAAPTEPATPEPVYTTAPVQKPAQVVAVAPSTPAAAPVTVATTPLGIWMSEKKEGKIRIEDCSGNLCGYAVDEKTGANGAKVLINMKPKGDKWAGRIHDTRSGGTYDSTIAMRGNDTLKVQGCALGGLFCGGETWTRSE